MGTFIYTWNTIIKTWIYCVIFSIICAFTISIRTIIYITIYKSLCLKNFKQFEARIPEPFLFGWSLLLFKWYLAWNTSKIQRTFLKKLLFFMSLMWRTRHSWTQWGFINPTINPTNFLIIELCPTYNFCKCFIEKMILLPHFKLCKKPRANLFSYFDWKVSSRSTDLMFSLLFSFSFISVCEFQARSFNLVHSK